MHLGRRSRDREATRWNWRLRFAELLLLPAGYWIYALVRDREGRAQRPLDFARAQVHGEALVHLESHVGMAWERGFQEVFLHWPVAVRALDSFWSYGYLVVTVAVVVAALCQRPQLYRRLRSVFALSTAVAIATFALDPTVPPRLLPASYGMVDTWATLGGIAARTPPEIERLSDPFASFPSIHVAWAAWCVIAVAAMTQRRWIRALMGSYLALTVIAVVATGNHYIIDCVSGAVLTVGAAVVVGTADRRRAGVAAGQLVPYWRRLCGLIPGVTRAPAAASVPVAAAGALRGEAVVADPLQSDPVPAAGEEPAAVAVAAPVAAEAKPAGDDQDLESSTALTA